MTTLGRPAGLRVSADAILGPQMLAVLQADIRGEEPTTLSPQHHVYLLDLGNVEKQLQIIADEIQGLRADLASRTIEARFQRLWSTIRAWWATVRSRITS